MKNLGLRSGVLLVLLGIGCGCEREQVQVYRVPKEPPPQAVAGVKPMTQMPGIMPAVQPQLKYEVPGGWTEQPPSTMRVASFKVGDDGKQADVSVIPLAGRAGGDLANVNRWRVEQAGLPALTEAEINEQAEQVEIAGQPGMLFDIAGTNPGSGDKTRILGAIQHREDTAWFYKMSGDDELVAAQKPAFVAFLKSVQFTVGDTGHTHAVSAGDGLLPAGHPPIDTQPAPSSQPTTSQAAGGPAWTVPADWKEAPSGQILFAKFLISGTDGAQATVNVSTSANDGGGLTANVNRWRGQLGLAPVSESELAEQVTTVNTAGGEIKMVELKGADASILGAMVALPGQAWFYKMMGTSTLVEQRKEEFANFLKGVRY